MQMVPGLDKYDILYYRGANDMKLKLFKMSSYENA